MEVPKEEVCSFQMTFSQGIRRMEEMQEEAVPHCQSGIQSHQERSFVEKKSRMEEKEEDVALFQEALRCLRLYPDAAFHGVSRRDSSSFPVSSSLFAIKWEGM